MSGALPVGCVPHVAAVPAPLAFTASDPPIGYYARTPTSGPERTLVERCAAQISACGSQAAPLALFFEPAMTQGYPDLVVGTYDPAHYAQWRLPRLHLERADLRLIVFLQSQATVDLGAILATHCGERRPVLRRLLRLAGAGIIVEQNGAWRVVAPTDVLGVRHIQAIEAKMHAVPRLIEQALHHSFYATETVLLLPHARLSLALTQAVERHGLGIWVQTPTACQRVRDATPALLRVSVESLRLNEWIGRRLVGEGRVVPLPPLEVDAAAWRWPTTAARSSSRFQQLCFGEAGTVAAPEMGSQPEVVAQGGEGMMATPAPAPDNPDATPTTFGNWLTQQCIAYQVRVGTWIQTDSAFAQLVGVAPSTFIMWRTNRAKPQRAHCRRLAEVFAVSPVEVQLALLLPLEASPTPSVAEAAPPMEAQDE